MVLVLPFGLYHHITLSSQKQSQNHLFRFFFCSQAKSKRPQNKSSKTWDVKIYVRALVAWETVSRPKKKGGGLKVLNINIQNKALLMKNLHKFFNGMDTPQVNLIWNSYYSTGSTPGTRIIGSFWWKGHLKLLDLCKSMARCKFGDGKSAQFWNDIWHDHCLHQRFPHLFSFAWQQNIFVQQATEKLYFIYLSLKKLMKNL